MTDQPRRPIQQSDKNDPDRPLTRKESNFVAFYVQTWSWIKAYEAAGYSVKDRVDSAKAAYTIGHRPAVAKAIQEAIKAAGLDLESVKTRLSQQAEINAADFMLFEDEFETVKVLNENKIPVIGEDGKKKTERRFVGRRFVGINWAEVEKRGYLIKGLEFSRQGYPILKFHDSQKALELVGRTHRMFVDRQELTGADGESLTVKVIKGVSMDEL